ncbi:hypothetical protein QYE76_012135 [Lolium multiflorum]|uniref:Retrotransposon gag domain-containing protein n=1 Tax=Lolium multiflorum TaxID=4521 RepID=A0AAD8U067_LOLMU|nr:hypothetical protein QYE76_012135 [Lolium multiflorum]
MLSSSSLLSTWRSHEARWFARKTSSYDSSDDESTYLRAPNAQDMARLLEFNADRGFPDMASSINFNQFLEKEKLKSNGSNFTDWFILESDLQKRFEHHDPHELIKELKTIFETHAAVECYEASKHFFSCMMEEGSSISEHMLVMTGHAKKLSDLGIVIPNRLGINRVLQSLPPSYKNFVMNYNMQNMNKEFPELFGMLKAAEIEIKKEHQVLMVNKTTSFKKQASLKARTRRVARKLPRLL